MAIILASKSPRRQELLHNLGLEFIVRTADIDETMDSALAPEQEVARVSAEKAAAIKAGDDDIVISADTIVVVDNEILGKPADEADAASMLRKLSGRRHEVMTAVTVRKAGEQNTQVVRTDVQFCELSDAEIRAYIATKEPMDKAGAYGVQGLASVFVRELRGDYFSVMGLPVCTLANMLKKFGVYVLGADGGQNT